MKMNRKAILRFACIAITLTLLLTYLCRNTFTDPSKIKFNHFSATVKELSENQPAMDSLFVSPGNNPIIKDIGLRDFYNNRTLITKFPNCYKLLKDQMCVEVIFFSNGCISFLLKKHSGFIWDRSECLIFKKGPGCDFSTLEHLDVEKEIDLKNGWTYKVFLNKIDL